MTDMITAKLVGLTQPTLESPAGTAEGLIAHCARVSSPRDYESRHEGAEGLLRYCMRNKHWSVFEMANAVVEVEAPRDITRQLLRHSSLRFQEFSQRYSDDITFCDRDLRLQDKKNRQNSIEVDPTETPGFEDAQLNMYETLEEIKHTYDHMRDHDVAKECARVILPEGLTMSTLYANGTLRSWLHYLDVRDDPGVTQHEHVLLAREIRKALEPAFPIILNLET